MSVIIDDFELAVPPPPASPGNGAGSPESEPRPGAPGMLEILDMLRRQARRTARVRAD